MTPALEYLLARPLMCTEASYEAALAIVQREPVASITALEAREARPVDGAELVTRRGSVALVNVCGPIYRYADFFTAMCGGVTTAALAKEMTAAGDDPSCTALVMYFDCPGGECTQSIEMTNLIKEIAARKIVIAYAGGQMCSLAMLLGSACTERVCEEMAELGCVGVRGSYMIPTADPRRPRIEIVSSQSPNKVPDLTTEKGKAQIQQLVDDMAGVMIGTIAKNLGMTPEDVITKFHGGGTAIGQKAVDCGMANRTGSLEGLIAELDKSGRAWSPGGMTMASTSLNSKEPQMATENKAPTDAPPVAQTPAPPIHFADTAEYKAMKAALDASTAQIATVTGQLAASKSTTDLLTASLETARQERTTAQAIAFCSSVADRVLPAEMQALATMYALAADDDLARPLATGSRVATLKASAEVRPKHGLYREQISAEHLPGNITIFGQRQNATDPNAPPTAERTDELLAKFPAGLKLLADQKKHG